MSLGLRQADRLLSITSGPVGPDDLILTAFEGEESFSRLFSFRLEMVSENTGLQARDMLGQPLSFAVNTPTGAMRTFSGIIRSFSAGGVTQSNLRYYSAEIVPALWFLTRSSNCKMYHNKKATDIVSEVLREYGVTDFSIVSSPVPAREYCVQYRETAFDFVSRLMEEEGIFYFFEHADGSHKLIYGDSTGQYKNMENSTLEYHEDENWTGIYHWAKSFAVTTAGYATTDYNFEDPGANMKSTANAMGDGIKQGSELFDYFGNYMVKSNGDTLAGIHAGEEEVSGCRVAGASRIPGLCPGFKFSVDQLSPEDTQQYVTSWVRHSARDDSQFAQTSSGPDYRNTFTCMPADKIFRPPRITPKAVVRGLQTAEVVGQGEINTDEHARIQVKFFWDRTSDTSCYIRVAQFWAGNTWGAQFIPRVGHEVVVAFLEGDPDRPLVVGSVYNGRNRPPFSLPDNKTQSGIRTRSSTGGSGSTCNEFRFEDKKGQEEVYLHAEKDMLVEVENDQTIDVDHDQTITVKNDRSKTIEEGNETIKISQGNRDTTISQGNDTLAVSTGNRKSTIQGSDTLTVTGAIKVTSSNSITETASMSVKVTANTSITLTCGPSSIKIDPSGVQISGPMVKINASGMAQIQAGGILTLSGAMVSIN